MSRIVIVILIYHRLKPIDLIYKLCILMTYKRHVPTLHDKTLSKNV
jgi:hypothetical protein